MEMLRKVMELFDKAIEAVARKLPPYPIDPLPWMWWIIILLLILPLILSSVM